eukprot:GHUV01031274.1.p1 GENE.GHUV01031274.1~~GHUV01031274.1.p1  ORF type:complete len:151 (+),score=20.03 GHUV01031274.1:217-669(+)
MTDLSADGVAWMQKGALPSGSVCDVSFMCSFSVPCLMAGCLSQGLAAAVDGAHDNPIQSCCNDCQLQVVAPAFGSFYCMQLERAQLELCMDPSDSYLAAAAAVDIAGSNLFLTCWSAGRLKPPTTASLSFCVCSLSVQCWICAWTRLTAT